MATQTQAEVNPFADAMKPTAFRASIAKIVSLPSKFPTASGGIRYQIYMVLVRWPTENNPTPATFSRYISGKRAIGSLGSSLRRLRGGRDPIPSEIDADCPIHVDWEERPQSDWKDSQGVYHPNRDQLVPLNLVSDTVPEEVVAACANARITREGMEVSEDIQGGSFEGEAITRFVSAVTGMKADDVAAIAENYSDLGPDVVSYIASNQALNQLVMEGKLNISEGGTVERVETEPEATGKEK